MSAGEAVLRTRAFRAPLRQTTRTYLETIRFAAANRLCVDLLYKDEVRRIEAYSLRQTRDGNLVLYAYDTRKQGIRCYRLDRIQNADVAAETFIPRYAVELTPSGPLPIRPTPARVAATSSPRIRRPAPRTDSRRHIYQCPLCQRRFYRMVANSTIKPHKNKNGWPCSGRTGIYRGLR